MLVGSVAPLMLAGLLYAGSGSGLMLLLLGRRLFDAHASFARPQRADWLWLAAAIFFGGVAGPVALMYGLVTSAASTASLRSTWRPYSPPSSPGSCFAKISTAG